MRRLARPRHAGLRRSTSSITHARSLRSRARFSRPLDRQVRTDGRANPIPGHNCSSSAPSSSGSAGSASTRARHSVWATTGSGSLCLRRPDDEPRRRARSGASSPPGVVLRKPDISMTRNRVIAVLVAITAALGLCCPVGRGRDRKPPRPPRIPGRCSLAQCGFRIDDPIGAVAVHDEGARGTLADPDSAVPALAENLAHGPGSYSYTGSFHQLGVQVLGLLGARSPSARRSPRSGR